MEIVKLFSPLPRVPWNGSKGFKRLGTKRTSRQCLHSTKWNGDLASSWRIRYADYCRKKGAIASSFCDPKGQNSSQNSRIFLMWIYGLTFLTTTTEGPCVWYGWTTTRHPAWARHCARHWGYKMAQFPGEVKQRNVWSLNLEVNFPVFHFFFFHTKSTSPVKLCFSWGWVKMN